MASALKEVRITNFKSLKDVKVSFGNFNVIVGRNGSGKTNLIESFKFLRNVLIEEKRPYIPYIDWWSYDNIVWRGKAELPIKITFKMEVLGFNVFYEFTFSVLGGVSRILNERLSVDGIVSIDREGQFMKIRHDEKFVKRYAKKIQRLLQQAREKGEKRITLGNVLEHTVSLPPDFRNLIHLLAGS